MNKTYPVKLITALAFILMLVSPLSAQEQVAPDSVFTFRFFSGKDMFYSPGLNNGPELKRIYDFIDQLSGKIKAHEIYVYVNGYCSSRRTTSGNLAIAKIRSNRVKSELITHKGLKESNFITKNHSGDGNFVTVSFGDAQGNLQFGPFVVNEAPAESNISEPAPVENISVPEPEPECVPAEEGQVEDSTAVEEAPAEQIASDSISSEHPRTKTDSRVALKTNLLDYAILMPNLELEWMFLDRWSVAIEGQSAWYAKGTPRKIYRLATLTPEFRFWPFEKKRWHGLYVGLFGGAGLYDLSNSDKGHEGEGFMVGVSAGYMWPISKHLSLEAGIGAGYARLRDKEYTPLDGHFLYQLTRKINYFGPLRLKFSLVWRIPW